MSKPSLYSLLLCVAYTIFISACQSKGADEAELTPVAYQDTPFEQEVSIKYPFEMEEQAIKVASDRNGIIQVLTDSGVFRPHAGAFLYPGKLMKDQTYQGLNDKVLKDLVLYQDQFVYLDSTAVLSNAWAGKLFDIHGLTEARMLSPSEHFTFIVVGKEKIHAVKENKILWSIKIPEKPLTIKYNSALKSHVLLTVGSIYRLDGEGGGLTHLYSGEGLTSFDFTAKGQKMVVGTTDGYFTFDLSTNKASTKNSQLPCPAILTVKNIKGTLWMGTEKGAFRVKHDGGFDYYFGERWLVGTRVIDIGEGKEGSILLLTSQGLSKLVFSEYTLHDKAMYFEDQVRNRHIRFGFNASLGNLEAGNVDSGMLKDSDNDGLWTAMYLAGQAFRYAVSEIGRAHV